MPYLIRFLVLVVAFAVIFSTWNACRSTPEAEPFPNLSGPYLGQTLPGTEPELFAPGIVNTGLPTRDVAISPDGDEIYFGASVGNFKNAAILFTRQVEGRWTEPEVASFSTDSRYIYGEPFVTADGQKLYYFSNQPLEGQSPDEASEDIWFVEREGDSWGPPRNLGAPINTDGGEFFPSLTTDGTLYYTHNDKGSRASFIFRSRLVDGVYQSPEKLPSPVNDGPNQFNAFVAPDESYLIIPTYREDSLGGVDYYISRHQPDGSWSELVNLGEKINSEQTRQWSPYVSPDGNLFFFMSPGEPSGELPQDGLTREGLQALHNSPENGYAKIYWVDASVLDHQPASPPPGVSATTE